MTQRLKCAPGAWRRFCLLLQGYPATCGHRWSRAAHCSYGTPHFNIIFNLKAVSGCQGPRARVPQVDIEGHLIQSKLCKVPLPVRQSQSLRQSALFLEKEKEFRWVGNGKQKTARCEGNTSETQAKHVEPNLSNAELW